MRCQPVNETLRQHYANLISFMLDGRVVPFLGAGANLCGRPKAAVWKTDSSEFLPSGAELSAYLAARFNCAPSPDLARVSQDVTLSDRHGRPLRHAARPVRS